nr:MAG TPA: hypothetical protein [Bacteriophage sp.]
MISRKVIKLVVSLIYGLSRKKARLSSYQPKQVSKLIMVS